MIKRLRIQFVCVIMAVVMLLSGGILGVVIHFTGVNMEMQSISTMRTIADTPTLYGAPGKLTGDIRTPYFAVQINRRGELTGTGNEFFDLSDKAYVLEVTNAALKMESDTGELKEYQLRYLKELTPAGYTIVFTDTASEAETLRLLILSSLLIFAVGMFLFFGISVGLSYWVIKPVEQAWAQQKQFVADASHELKTPLSVIMANAELLQNSEACEAEHKKFSDSILSMSYQMRSLVESLLDMARLDNSSTQMKTEPLDLSQLVSDAVLSVQLLYDEKEIALSSDIPENTCIKGSQQHLYQLMDVLLDNALKYSSPAGHVHVKLTQQGHSCLLSVSNTGDAISKEDLTNIFKRFYRADKARTSDGSYGLGLSIAQSIVTGHKGKIWAQSENGINTFFVQLPLCAHPKQ